MEYAKLLRLLTVDCKDNGERFIDRSRISVLQSLLADTSYQLIYEGELSLVYAQPGFFDSSFRVLISSHLDCVYSSCFFQQVDEQHWCGTFDNSATNAAVVDLMLRRLLPPFVAIAFTGDEEVDSRGAIEVLKSFNTDGVMVDRCVVLDVSHEGYDDEAVCSVENDRNFDILTGYRLINTIQKSNLPCVFLHDAEPDETWEYGRGGNTSSSAIPCLSLCLPVGRGDMHSDDGVYLRRSSIDGYQSILIGLIQPD